jgi:hypothetical protein
MSLQELLVVVPPLPVARLTLLLYVAFGLCGLLAVAVVALELRLRGIRRRYARLLDGADRGDLLTLVSRQIEAVGQLRGKLDLIGRETAQLRQRLSSVVRTVGFTRYNAFPDTGGELSFSAAFLDEAGNGMVLSSISGRSESRLYAKRVTAGRSEHGLSDEEQAAVALALDGTAAALVPGTGSDGAGAVTRSRR